MPDPSDQDPHSACSAPINVPANFASTGVFEQLFCNFTEQKHLAMPVTVETVAPGDGATYPKKGDSVTIHYVGTLTDGRKFDSSRDRGSPFIAHIGTGRVIRGLDEGIMQLSLGQKAVLTISPDYAYGARGFPPAIPPNSTLKFDLELIKIN